MHIHVHTRTHTHTHVHRRTRIHTYMLTHTHTHTHTRTPSCTLILLHVCFWKLAQVAGGVHTAMSVSWSDVHVVFIYFSGHTGPNNAAPHAWWGVHEHGQRVRPGLWHGAGNLYECVRACVVYSSPLLKAKFTGLDHCVVAKRVDSHCLCVYPWSITGINDVSEHARPGGQFPP